jgi:hypothetical protein
MNGFLVIARCGHTDVPLSLHADLGGALEAVNRIDGNPETLHLVELSDSWNLDAWDGMLAVVEFVDGRPICTTEHELDEEMAEFFKECTRDKDDDPT